MNIYRPQRSWGKVIFSQVSVILFTGGVCLSACWNTLLARRPPLTRQTPSSPLARRPPSKADPLPAVHAGRYVGGMQPTRMHFLFCTFLLLEDISVLCNSVLDLGDVFPRLQNMRRSLASLSRACNGLPQIQLWCDNCRPFSGQHGSRTLYQLIFSNRSGNPWFQVLAQLLHL